MPLLIWLYEVAPAVPFGSLSYPLLTLGIVFLAALQGLYLAIPLCIFIRVRKNNLLDVFVFSALFILGEWIQESSPFLAFPWGRMGITMSNFVPFIQTASLFGSLFISFLVLCINCLIYLIIININKPKKLLPIVSTLLAIFLGNLTFGLIRLNTESDNENKFEVVLVQGNFSGQDKWSATAQEMLKQYISLSKGAVTPNTKLIVWPETAIPLDLEKNPEEKNAIIKLAKDTNATVITGITNKTFDPDKRYNSMVAISPSGTISKPYSKQILVPFGEVVPFENFIKSISKILENYNSFSAGKGSDPIKTDIGKVGGVICYESIFPKISRKTVQNGSELIVIISNDSWFGESPALYQHHCHAIMRAVENNRYIVRSSNTAVTSVISPYGKILCTAEPFVDTTLTADVSLIEKRTLYSYIGDIIVLIPISIFIVELFSIFNEKFQRKKYNYPSR